MPISADYKLFIEDLLSPHGAVRIRAMFGGAGVYLDELMVAILADDELYLRADADSERAFIEAGCTQFTYEAKGETMAMKYWSCPEDAFDEPEVMANWLSLSRAAAVRTAARKKPKTR